MTGCECSATLFAFSTIFRRNFDGNLQFPTTRSFSTHHPAELIHKVQSSVFYTRSRCRRFPRRHRRRSSSPSGKPSIAGLYCCIPLQVLVTQRLGDAADKPCAGLMSTTVLVIVVTSRTVSSNSASRASSKRLCWFAQSRQAIMAERRFQVSFGSSSREFFKSDLFLKRFR